MIYMEPEPGPAGRVGAGIDNFPGHSRQSTVGHFPISNSRTLLGRAMRKAQSANFSLSAFCALRNFKARATAHETGTGGRGVYLPCLVPCALHPRLAPQFLIMFLMSPVPRVSFARACPPREASFSALERKIPNSPSKLPESLHAVSGLPPQLKTHKSESSKRLKGPI